MASLDSSIEDSLCSSLGSLDILQVLGSTEYDTQQENEFCLPNSFVDRIIMLFLKHNLSLVCLEDVMKLLNENRELCEKLPTKKKYILNLFREHRDLIEIFYFVKCNKCKKTVKIDSASNEKVKCCGDILKKTETNFFVYMPIKKQIAQSIAKNWDYIKGFNTSSKSDGSYSDAHDGEVLKTLLKQYENEDANLLSLCINLDGANKFNSNTHSLWPIQLTQNYLPPQIRFQTQNIIVCGLLYTDSEDKLNFRDYMLPLITELNQLKKNNIVMEIEKEEYMLKPVITHGVFDLPAKSKVQETKQFGGYDACTYCENPGELISVQCSKAKMPMKRNNKKNENRNKDEEEKTKKFVRYVEQEHDYPLRDEVETLKKMLVASTSSKNEAVDGIKGKINATLSLSLTLWFYLKSEKAL